MTLQAGPPPSISVSQINTELGLATTTAHNLGATDMRTLAGIATGAIDMASFYGKTRRVVINYTLASNYADGNMRTAAIAAGWDTVTPIDLTVTINSGVYCYASSTGVYAVLSGTFVTNSIVKLVNNGGILGCGGAGAAGKLYQAYNANSVGDPGAAAGPAFGVGAAITLSGAGFIGGGGGGGGSGGNGLYWDGAQWYGCAGGGGGGGRANGGGGLGGSTYNNTFLVYLGSAAGGAGSLIAGGAGGNPLNYGAGAAGGAGGAGGDVGGAGGTGVTSQCNLANHAGGAGGAFGLGVQGWSIVTGTCSGGIYGGTAG